MRRPRVALCLLVILLIFGGLVLAAARVIDPPIEREEAVTGLITAKKSATNLAAIVFVHGIAGHFEGTWTDRNLKRPWFELLKTDPRFESFDLYTLAYESHQPGPTTFSGVLDRLERPMRDGLAGYQEVYLIAHSLGGIVAQKLLMRTALGGYRSVSGFPGNVKLVIFLATPGQSENLATVMNRLTRNPLWGYLANHEFVSDTVDEWLRFQGRQREIESVCAAERLGIRGLPWRIVSEESAQRPCGLRSKVTIQADHITIAKPAGCGRDPYSLAAVEIQGRALEVREKRPEFPAAPKECQPSSVTRVVEGGLSEALWQLGFPWKVSLGRASAETADVPKATDFESLKRSLLENRDSSQVASLLNYLKPGGAFTIRAANVVGEIFKLRKDPSKDREFFGSMARLIQDASLTAESPFRSIDFSGADFSDLDLRYANFEAAHMLGANFLGANLEKASFKRACLEKARFSSATRFAWINGANFAEADLTNAEIAWERTVRVGRNELAVGLSRAGSVDSAILASKQRDIPKERAEERGVVFLNFARWSPCAAVPGAPRPVPELKPVYFEGDSFGITATMTSGLEGHVRWLKANPNYLVLLEGHSGEAGTNEYNLALGERRVKSVMNYLVSQGIPASRITILSSGRERLPCPDKTPECVERNRRVTFLVTPRPLP